MSKTTKDKDDRMTITVEKGEETVSFQTDPDLHISEFRDLMMRLAAAVGYDQSNIEEYFLRDDEKGECCGAKYDKPNEETIRNFESDKPNVDMGGNYDED
jgi:hypothetical protein